GRVVAGGVAVPPGVAGGVRGGRCAREHRHVGAVQSQGRQEHGVTVAVPKVKEPAFQRQVLQLARLTGWRSAHFRPGLNKRGEWQTAVAGDGKGFPDLVLIRERVLFVELKTDAGALSPEQRAWRDALLDAGADWQ